MGMLAERAGYVESVKIPDYPVGVLVDALDVDAVDVDEFEPSFSDMEYLTPNTE